METQILLVDPNYRRATHITSLLESVNLTVEHAEDGWTALVKLPVPQADLVIVELALPDMEGAEFVHKLRDIREYRDVPLKALYTPATKKEALKAREFPYVQCVLSPFESRNFINSVVSTVLQNHWKIRKTRKTIFLHSCLQPH